MDRVPLPPARHSEAIGILLSNVGSISAGVDDFAADVVDVDGFVVDDFGSAAATPAISGVAMTSAPTEVVALVMCLFRFVADIE
jgi:hypothetical protein